MLDKKSRLIMFARLSVPFNALLAAGKLVMGIFTSSIFLWLNAFYNIGMGLSKYLAVKTHFVTSEANSGNSEHYRTQCKYYRVIGFLIIGASLVYALYCIRLFVQATETRYTRLMALTIAAVTFTEIVLSLCGARTMRREREPMLEAVKLASFASSLISLVLTQTALLSFTMPQRDLSLYNGITGIVLGSAAAVIGIFMVVRIHLITKGGYARSAKKYIEKKVSEPLLTIDTVRSDMLPIKLAVTIHDCGEQSVKALAAAQKKYDAEITLNGFPLKNYQNTAQGAKGGDRQ